MCPFDYARIPLYLDYVKLNEGILGQIKIKNFQDIEYICCMIVSNQWLNYLWNSYHGVTVSKQEMVKQKISHWSKNIISSGLSLNNQTQIAIYTIFI